MTTNQPILTICSANSVHLQRCHSTQQLQVAWLKKTASGGVMGGAHDRLLRCGPGSSGRRRRTHPSWASLPIAVLFPSSVLLTQHSQLNQIQPAQQPILVPCHCRRYPFELLVPILSLLTWTRIQRYIWAVACEAPASHWWLAQPTANQLVACQ